MTVLEQLPEGSRIAIIRLRSLGDCVLTTPGLALLKEARPDLSVGVAVENRFRAVFTGNPAIKPFSRPHGKLSGAGNRRFASTCTAVPGASG